jgi:hypothetical protein
MWGLTMRKRFRFPIVLTDHVFDKIRSIDMTMAEFERLLGTGEIIEEHVLSSGSSKELVLLLESTRPLHIVVVVDEGSEEERILTVYEPDPARWDADFRSRR